MVVNWDVDGYTIPNPRLLDNTPKNAKNNLLKTKRILKPKFKQLGVRFVPSACQGERFAHLLLR